MRFDSLNPLSSLISTTMSVKSAVYCSLVVLASLVLAPEPVRSAQATLKDQGVKPTPFPVCIDDSDCSKLGQGTKYACFQYICYPWKDDSNIKETDKRKLCRKDADCESGQECFRHHDKRHVNQGLCFDEIQQCDVGSDCKPGRSGKPLNCCGGSCCEEPYFNQFKSLPCTSHLGCEDLGLGKFCCPRTNTTSVCCDTDPNPRPTFAPNTRGMAGGAISTHSSFQAFTSILALGLMLVIH